MASLRQPNAAIAAHSVGGKYVIGSSVTPVRKEDGARRDGTCQQQQQFRLLDVGDHAAFRCTACDRQFASRKYLSMHMALHNMATTKPSPLLLPVVGSDVRVSKRNARAVSSPEQWFCPVCRKTFSQKSNFRNHVRTHSDERPFVCLVCLIGFKERYHLKKHTLFKHSPGQLNETCQQCGKRFKDLTAVRAHERTHSNVRPYGCTRCDKTFKTSECLWHHENRSKTCGRAASIGDRPYCYEVNASAAAAVGQSLLRCRQRRGLAARHAPLSTTSESHLLETDAGATVATSLMHFVEYSSTKASVSRTWNTTCGASDVCALVTSGAKTETAKSFDRDVGTVCTTSLAWHGVASRSLREDNNVDVTSSTSADCFDDLNATTTNDAVVDGGGSGHPEVPAVCGKRFRYNRSTSPTDLSSQNEYCRQSSFDVVSSDAAPQTISEYSERRQFYYQTKSGCQTQQSGTTGFYDVVSISGCSTKPSAYESGSLSTQSSTISQAMFEPSRSNGVPFRGLYLPTAVVTPIELSSVTSPDVTLLRRGVTSPARRHAIPSPLQPPANTFHLPPIETLAPRRQPLRLPVLTWSWSSFPREVPTDRLHYPQQQCPPFAKHLTPPSGSGNPIIYVNKPKTICDSYIANC